MSQTSNSHTKSTNCTNTIKFLYSYKGRILPRVTDGKLRYIGGYTRVLSVDHAITFAELMAKFEECCGYSVKLKCKLPREDLDVLVSLKSDEDVKNVIEEYDRISPGTQIRAFLFPINSSKKISPPSSPVSCFDFPRAHRRAAPTTAPLYNAPPQYAPASAAVRFSITPGKHPRHLYQVPHWNYCRSN